MNELKEKNVILQLYEFYNNYGIKHSKEYEILLHEFNEMRDKTNKMLTKEQEQEIDKLFELFNKVIGEANKQNFIETISLGIKLVVEALSVKKRNFGIMEENRIEEILKDFDEHFETKTNERIKNKPIIMNVFNQFIDEIFEADKKYKLVFDKQQELLKELNLNEKQQELFEKWEDCQSRILDDRVERAFIYAWAIADEIHDENKRKYDK